MYLSHNKLTLIFFLFCYSEFVAIGNYIWKTGGMKFSDLKPQFVGGFMFERVVCPVLAAPEKFGLLTSCPPGSEKVQSTLLSALEVASKILVVICNPSAVVPEPAPELQNPEILKVYKSFRTSFKYFVVNLPQKHLKSCVHSFFFCLLTDTKSAL